MREVKLTELTGIGDATAKTFSELGITNVWDLLHYYPRTYQDYSKVISIIQALPGIITVRAKILDAKGRYVRRGMHITEATADDSTGKLRLIWFNQPYRANSIKNDQEYFITGKLEFKAGKYAINSPTIELVSEVPIHTARIIPIYKETKGVSTKLIRKAMSGAIKYTRYLDKLLPDEIIDKNNLLTYAEALNQLHFPESTQKLEQAKRTMSFIELFELILASSILKNQISSELAPKIDFNEHLAKQLVSSLPFKLTDAQKKTMWQILQDIDSTQPANRLVEGDVGSGKTVVAVMAITMALNAGYQVAYLAPTEILARQHFDNIKNLLKPLKLSDKVELLVGSLNKKQKDQIHQKLTNNEISFIIGTHALLQGISIKNLGLLIIDEQHRFGVDQRKELLKQNGMVPHVISMTATPIPRSLALTLYGELDISLLDAMPPGRKQTITKIVSPNSRESMESQILEQIEKGHQIYVVCPLIDENGKIQSTSVDKTYKRLVSLYKNKKVGLLHGKLKSDVKNKVMQDFLDGNLDILVSTTVIEVGVNVPNATVMVIEGAERFGLAQMHQLRGRVGRSSDQAFCFLVPSDSKAPSKRLRAFAQVNDGFRLAELDLEIRGPGAIYGTLQHGSLDLRFTNLTDHKLLSEAKQSAKYFLTNLRLNDYPELKRRVRLAQAVITLN